MTMDTKRMVPPIAGYHPTTLIDWPGRLAAIVFLPGCNLRCPFCHAGPLLGTSSEAIPLEGVLEHIASRGGWIDGVVVCGGEPTVWPGVGLLCAEFRRAGLRVKLDTNGTRPDRLRQLMQAGLVDAVAMDVKAPLDERYHAACGTHVDLEAVGESVDLLMGSDLEYEFRTTVCPAFVAEQAVHDMGARIAGAARWVLQRFEPANCLDPAMREVEPYGPARMEALADIGRMFVGRCVLRGQPEPQVAAAEGV